MNDSQHHYEILIQKLDAFIRKYYLNQLLRGLIYSGAVIIAYFLLINLLEHFLFLSTTGRKILFYSFILLVVGIGYRLILLPLLHYGRLGNIISHEQAALIIGKHFREVEDRLLNVLQLKKLSDAYPEELLLASIRQKTEQLRPIPFTAAIDLRQNRRYLKYLLLPVLVLIIFLLAAPNVIKESSRRLLYNNQVFEKPAPFRFRINNNILRAIQYEDFELQVIVEGEALPAEVYLHADGYAYKMSKKSSTLFTYTFTHLQQDVDFYLSAHGYQSAGYQLRVIPKPSIAGFEVQLQFPAYIGRQPERLKNIGDLTLPAGTQVTWLLETKNTRRIDLIFAPSDIVSLHNMLRPEYTRTFRESGHYKIKLFGDELPEGDSVLYAINIIPDQYPAIFLQTYQDSLTQHYIYFTGDISDDYGLSKLLLKYKILRPGEPDTDGDYLFEAVPFPRGSRQTAFSYYWDLKKINLLPGEQLVYFFEVWDNDAVNGSKATRSHALSLYKPSYEQLEQLTHQSNEQIKEKLNDAIREAADLKKQIDALKNKILERKNLGWEDKKSIEKVLEQQKSLENDLRSLQQEMSKNHLLQQEKGGRNEEIIKKQQQLEKMFNELMSDEMKKLYEQLEALLDELNKKDLLDKLDDFRLSQEELEKELDRMLSLFKHLELEQKMKDAISKLEQLAQQQEELSNKTKEAKESELSKLSEQQSELNKKFDELKDDLNQMEKTARELDMPADFTPQKQMADEISGLQQESQKNLNQHKNKKASEQQKNAAEKMQQLSNNLNALLEQMQAEQLELDLRAIRQLLENLISLSFDQEHVMEEIAKTNINDPKYLQLIQKQRKIKDDTKMVEDSLFALSKRVFQLEAFINKEMRDINKHMSKALEYLELRSKSEAARDQQYVMTGFNNLALMLSESMEQMQQQMASQSGGTPKMCQGKKNSRPNTSMSQLQQQLNDKIDKLAKEMKSGKIPGKGEMSKQMAEFAQKQAAIREALRQLLEEEGKQQGGKDGLSNELTQQIKQAMEQMDKTETELANKKLTEELLIRQKEIFTRLLEAEEALRKREQDNQRESHTAKDIERPLPPSLEEYLKKREAEILLYKTVPPTLSPYYKQLVEKYFKSISF